MVIKFIENYPPYVKGDVAGIKDTLAKKLIEAKKAEPYVPEVVQAELSAQDEPTGDNLNAENTTDEKKEDAPTDSKGKGKGKN